MNAIIFSEAVKTLSTKDQKSAKECITKTSKVSIKRQCELLGINRSSYYTKDKRKKKRYTKEEEKAMELIDKIHTQSPCFGARKISAMLNEEGIDFGRRHTQRLMREMAIEPIYPKPNLSKNTKQHPQYPYLLRHKQITFPNQVYATDITYIPLCGSHVYLSAVIDWYSRYIVSWRLHDTIEAEQSCICMEKAFIDFGVPAIANSDQGSTYTAQCYVDLLAKYGVAQSMDGKRRWVDNVIVERFFRTLKQECIYIEDYSNYRQLRRAIAKYIDYYNNIRIHQSLSMQTPAKWYFSGINQTKIKAA